MTQFIIETHDEERANLLLELLRQLDVIDSIRKIPQMEKGTALESNDSEDFFSLAGIWRDRDISIDTIRQQAWPDRSS